MNMKKLLALLMAAVMVLSLGTAAFASGEASAETSDEASSEASSEASEEVAYEVEDGAIFLDTSGEYSFRERALDLVSRMTLEEKASQMVNNMSAIPRLGVESYNVWSEALHGINSGNCTSYPISIAMGSTWNRELEYEVAEAISYEGRAYYNTATGGDFIGGGLTFWSPVVEPARDPRWGRTDECLSEDTYLTSEMAGQFVEGMQGDGTYYRTVTTAKHYIANNIENTRQLTSSKLDETGLYEYYIRPYRSLLLNYGLHSVMSSYNRVNNVPTSASVTLLDTLARKTWGLDGYVTGDCDAVSIVSKNHNYVGTRFADEEQSSLAIGAALTLIAGVDSNCLGDSSSYVDAVESGYVSEDELDEAVVNMYAIRFALGEFDDGTEWDDLGEESIESDDEVALAEKAADEAIVLLENNGILPLSAEKLEGKTIAVMGPFADDVSLGGYSSAPTKTVSPLEALQTYIDENDIDCEIVYNQGGEGYKNNVLYYLNGFYLIYEDGSEVYYDATDFDTENSSSNLKMSKGSPSAVPCIPVYDGSVLSFSYAELEGAVGIRIDGATDGGVVVDITSQGTKNLGYYEFADAIGTSGGYGGVEGETEDLDLNTSGQVNADITFTFSAIPEDYSDEAAQIAAEADITLLFVGADTNTANEGNDRETLDFPGVQDELISSVLGATDNAVLIMTGMNMFEIEDYKDDAAAVIWYGFNGQHQGSAIADTLFGDVNPSGRLPFTWYTDMDSIPDMYDYSMTGESVDGESSGRTYMYYDGDISYAFGYGLSYTTFEYSNFTVSADTFTPNDTLTFTVDVTNTGDVAGKEVVQLYYSAPDADEADRPVKQLCQFDKIELQPGETKTVTLTVDASDLWYYDDPDGDSLNQEENEMVSPTANTSADLVVDGSVAYLNGEYTFEVASAASDNDNAGPAERSLTVTSVMEGELTEAIQTVTLQTGDTDTGKAQFIDVGEEIPTVLTVALNNDTFLDDDAALVTYESNRPDVISVDENGVLTAVSAGVATITATVSYNGSTMTGECAVLVK